MMWFETLHVRRVLTTVMLAVRVNYVIHPPHTGFSFAAESSPTQRSGNNSEGPGA